MNNNIFSVFSIEWHAEYLNYMTSNSFSLFCIYLRSLIKETIQGINFLLAVQYYSEKGKKKKRNQMKKKRV